MKKAMILALGLAALVLSASAQVPNWEIKLTSTDIKTLQSEVDGYIRNGYRPVGITYDDREFYILYLHEPSLEISSWLLEWYDSLAETQQKLTENMNKGLTPMGLTFTGDKFYILYLGMESGATAWRLEPSGTDLASVQQRVKPYSAQGYVPVGITAYQDQYWTLLLKLLGTAVTSWLIESYDVGTHGSAIDAAIRRGYMPWGLEYSGVKRIDILYVAF